MIVEAMQKKGLSFFFAGSCRVLLKEFRARRWLAMRWWAGPEPVSRWTLLLWPFTAPLAGLSLLGLLLWYRLRHGVRTLYCLSLTEKILGTIPARLCGMRVIWIEHVTCERWLSQNPLRWWYARMARLVNIVPVSHVIATQLQDDIHVPAERIQVIYTGINLKQFVRKDYDWEKSARYNIGCVARLEKEKGIEYLLHALKIVREFVPFARLIIVGEGSERKKLTWLTERLDLKEHVQWIGRQRDVAPWYHYFDAYVLPSVTRESFGITILEAMASGIPVIASRIGGTGEIITHGVNGRLAQPGNSQDLADQLLWLYNNRSAVRTMVDAAYDRVAHDFSEVRMMQQFYALLVH